MYCRLLRIPILNSAKLLVAFSRHDYFIIYSLILIFPSILLFNHIQRTIYITFCFCCPQPGNDMISVSFFRLFRVMRLVKLLSKVQYSRHAGTAHTIQQRRNSTTNYSARYSTVGTLAQHTQYISIVIVPPTTQQGTVQKAHWHSTHNTTAS